METKSKLVAISFNENNECVDIFSVKNLTEKEYNKLLNEKRLHDNELLEKEKAHNDFELETNNRLGALEKRDLYLAKSIYDNFVDLGLLNGNDKFQKDFYDFVFNGCGLDIENTPNDFQIILRKVGSK